MAQLVTQYVGFGYGEGTKLNIDNPDRLHDHEVGGEERGTLQPHIGRLPTNHVGYTLLFKTVGGDVTMPDPHKPLVQQAADLVEAEFAKAKLPLMDEAHATTMPVPVAGKNGRPELNEKGLPCVEYGQSLTQITFRMPRNVHPQARHLVQRLNTQLQKLTL